MTPATMYRQDGNSYWIIDFGTMSLTMESMTYNSGWGVFGTKPANWQESLWDTANQAPTTWIDILGNGLTDARLHRVRTDITFMSDTYVLLEAAVVETTDFMSAILPEDATFSRESSATMFDAAMLLEYGPENLVLYSQDLANAAWTPSFGGTGSLPVVTANDATAPDGTMTATKAIFDSGSGTTSGDWSRLESTAISMFEDLIFAYSLWLKADSGTQIRVEGLTYDTVFTCTGEWKQFWISGATFYGGPNDVSIGIDGTINSSATVWICGVQLERPAFRRHYLPTTGAPIYGLRFDHDPLSGALLGALAEPSSTNGFPVSTRNSISGPPSTRRCPAVRWLPTTRDRPGSWPVSAPATTMPE